MILQNIRVALSSLLRNRLRTTLTITGIGIGIAAVICTAALGAAGATRVQGQMDALGEDFLWIRAGNRTLAGIRTGFGGARTLKASDATALVASVPQIATCSPVGSGRQQVIAGGQNWNTRYQAVLPAYFQVRRRTAVAGSLFIDADNASAAKVIVIGSTVAARLFGTAPAVGQVIRMNQFPFRVIGVLDSRGSGAGALDRDDAVFVPFETATRYLDGRDWVSDIMCGVRSPDVMSAAEVQATSVLRDRHQIRPDAANDFQIQRPLDILQLRAESARTMALMLTAIGGVSLLVGGIGIMNIMLVSVVERRREIGVRLAIGARVRDIRGQFLLEASAIGLVGAAVGIGIGWAGAWILSSGFDWPTTVTTGTIVVAAASAIAAALVFGYYPAHRASLLDPIEAIRIES